MIENFGNVSIMLYKIFALFLLPCTLLAENYVKTEKDLLETIAKSVVKLEERLQQCNFLKESCKTRGETTTMQLFKRKENHYR